MAKVARSSLARWRDSSVPAEVAECRWVNDQEHRPILSSVRRWVTVVQVAERPWVKDQVHELLSHPVTDMAVRKQWLGQSCGRCAHMMLPSPVDLIRSC